jgi:hypothetical protein
MVTFLTVGKMLGQDSMLTLLRSPSILHMSRLAFPSGPTRLVQLLKPYLVEEGGSYSLGTLRILSGQGASCALEDAVVYSTSSDLLGTPLERAAKLRKPRVHQILDIAKRGDDWRFRCIKGGSFKGLWKSNQLTARSIAELAEVALHFVTSACHPFLPSLHLDRQGQTVIPMPLHWISQEYLSFASTPPPSVSIP